MSLDDAGDIAPDADAVRAHDDGVALAVLAQVHGAGRDGEVRPQLEDVADLDPLPELHRRAARDAGVALAGLGDLGDDVRRVVARDVHVLHVPADAVRAGDEVRRAHHQLVDDDDGIRRPDWRAVAGLHPAGHDLLDRGRPEPARRLDRVDELRLVDVVVAADDRHDEPAVAGHEECRLRRLAGGDAQERRERVDRGRAGRLDVLHRQGVLRLRIGLADLGDLLVLGVAALIAQDERVLAVVVEDHELMSAGAAHDPDIGTYRDRFEAQPLERPLIGAVLIAVALVEAGVIPVAAIGVLHDELADADQAAPGSRLVAELRLEVVDHHRQLAIALHDVAEEDRDDLLVGHRENHVALAAILEAHELGADLEVAAALLPDLGRMDDRHLHLLGADPVLLFADDLLDALADAEPERQQRVDPGAQRADIAGSQEKPVRRHLGVGGIVAERREEEVTQAHPRRIAAGRPRQPTRLLAFRPCRRA
jgi:hypothetical protein